MKGAGFTVASSILLACASSPRPAPAPAPETETARLRRQSEALAPLVSGWVRRFVAAAPALPDVTPRTLYRDVEKTRWLNALEYGLLPDNHDFAAETFDAEYFYETRYGSPLAYARALEVAEPAEFDPASKKVFDFGYGGIGHLRMLAWLGADARGVDVDPILRALYSAPEDQGVFGAGRVALLSGRFPADPAIVARAGTGYDLVISKNVLKRGYIHPEQPVDPKKTVQLGVDDDAFLAAIAAMLAPGGRFLIYNICPGPNRAGKPYLPWADGRSPFSSAAFDRAGLRLLAFEKDDLPAVRAMARKLGWDREDPPMDLEHDLQAQYTLAERPVGG